MCSLIYDHIGVLLHANVPALEGLSSVLRMRLFFELTSATSNHGRRHSGGTAADRLSSTRELHTSCRVFECRNCLLALPGKGL